MMRNTYSHNGMFVATSTPRKEWRVIRKTLCIDSRDRNIQSDMQHPGDYYVTLPAVYKNVRAITLKSYEIPMSFLTFTRCQGNTEFNININGSTYQLLIDDGNYPIQDLLTDLQTKLNTLSEGTFTLTQLVGSNKVVITNSTANVFTLLPQSAATSTNCGEQLPFDRQIEYGLPYYLGFLNKPYVSSGSGTITLEGTTYSNYIIGDIQAVGDPTTYIMMELEGLNKLDETYLEGKKSGNVDGAFAKIIVDGNSGDYLFFTDTGTNPLNRRVYSPPISKLDKLHIKFRRHDGRTIDFNGGEHSFTLELEILDNNFDEFSSLEFSRY